MTKTARDDDTENAVKPSAEDALLSASTLFPASEIDQLLDFTADLDTRDHAFGPVYSEHGLYVFMRLIAPAEWPTGPADDVLGPACGEALHDLFVRTGLRAARQGVPLDLRGWLITLSARLEQPTWPLLASAAVPRRGERALLSLYLDDRTGAITSRVGFDDGTVYGRHHARLPRGWDMRLHGSLAVALDLWFLAGTGR